MANKFTLLNKAQEQRLSKRSGISSSQIKFVFGLVITTLILLLLAFNLKLLLEVKAYSSQKADIMGKLNLIEETVNNNTKQVNDISDKVNQFSSDLSVAMEKRIREIYVDIGQLRDTADAQSAAIENLTKAKNTLFKRVSELETENIK